METLEIAKIHASEFYVSGMIIYLYRKNVLSFMFRSGNKCYKKLLQHDSHVIPCGSNVYKSHKAIRCVKQDEVSNPFQKHNN